MLHFVYGTKNSEKSEYVARRITEHLQAGEQVILLVPERRSVATEKAMLTAVPDRYKLNLEVLSFRRLCNRVFREYGGLRDEYIGTGGKLLVLWRILRQSRPMLKVYGDLDLGNKKVISALLQTLTAFDRAALSNQTLEELAEAAREEGNEVLSNKLCDLILIRSGYRAVLHGDFNDPEEDLDRLCDILDSHPFFENYTVFIDETSSFSGKELQVLARIFKQSPSVTVTVGRDPADKREIFRKLDWFEKALRDLSEEVDNCVVLPDRQEGPDALRALRKELFAEAPTATESTDGVTLYSCESKAEEADMIAISILDAVSAGGRWREHAVALRDPEQYRGILDRRLRAAGIPFYYAQTMPLSAQTAVKSLLAAMTLVVNNYRLKDMDAYLKAGFTPLDFSQICRVIDYASIWQIEGSRWKSDREWCMNPKGRSIESDPKAPIQLAELNRLKNTVMLPLEELAADQRGELTVLERASLLWRFYEKNGYPDRILADAHRKNEAGDSAGAMRLCQTNDLICECLDELTAAVGDLPCSLSLFCEMLSAVIDEKSVGSIPQKNDEVLITDVFSLGSQRFPHLYVPGLCDGSFPLSGGGGGLFNDAELLFFKNKKQVELPGIEAHRAIDEFFAFAETVAAAKEHLTLSFPTKDNAANGTSPSPFIASVTEVLPALFVQPYAELPFTRRLGNLPMLTRMYHAGNTGTYWERFEKVFLCEANKENYYGGGIGDAFALSLYGDDMMLSQSKLEKFISCPFSYACAYLFKLREEVASDTAANEYGTLMHAVFEEVLQELCAQGDPATADDAVISSLIDKKITDFGKAMVGDEDDPRTKQLLRRASVTAFLLLSGMKDEFGHSLFRPAFFELPFGIPKDGDALSLPALQYLQDEKLQASIRGIADRVDLYKTGNTVYFRIVDYKTGNKEFESAELEKGLSGQMLLYMRAVCTCRDPDFLQRIGADENTVFLPASIVYCIAKRPDFVSEPGMTAEEILASAKGKIERHGIAIDDPALLKALDTTPNGTYLPTGKAKEKRMSAESFTDMMDQLPETLADVTRRIHSGCIDIDPLKEKDKDACRYCAYRPVCRHKDTKEKGDEE